VSTRLRECAGVFPERAGDTCCRSESAEVISRGTSEGLTLTRRPASFLGRVHVDRTFPKFGAEGKQGGMRAVAVRDCARIRRWRERLAYHGIHERRGGHTARRACFGQCAYGVLQPLAFRRFSRAPRDYDRHDTRRDKAHAHDELHGGRVRRQAWCVTAAPVCAMCPERQPVSGGGGRPARRMISGV
jgi:hypothetical protein